MSPAAAALVAAALLLIPALSPFALAAVVPAGPQWSACDTSPGPVECTELLVPLDHRDPQSPSIGLPVRRLPATDERARIGVLVTIAGGPGQRGTLGVGPGVHGATIEARFDIVSWDPRGTAGDTLIDCIPQWDPFAGLDRTPDTRIERLALDARTRTLAVHCRERHANVLPYITTYDAALDLERLRRMLGEPRISLLGSSYGSRVAATYATLFPEHVRAVVLDGYSDPNRSPGRLELEQAAAYERQLEALLDGCADDPACSLASGGDPGVALDTLLASLDRAPLPAGAAGRLTQSDAYEAIVGYLTRDREARGRLLEALGSALLGDGEPLLGLAARVRSDYESSGLTMGAFMAIHCADTAAWWSGRSDDEIDRLTERIQRVAPRLGPFLWSPPLAADLPAVGLCAMQPLRSTNGPSSPRERVDAAGAGPVLVLTSSGDPATPRSAARRALQDLADATLLTLDADTHVAYLSARRDPGRPAYACLLDAVEAFLIDLERPAQSRCADA